MRADEPIIPFPAAGFWGAVQVVTFLPTSESDCQMPLTKPLDRDLSAITTSNWPKMGLNLGKTWHRMPRNMFLSIIASIHGY